MRRYVELAFYISIIFYSVSGRTDLTESFFLEAEQSRILWKSELAEEVPESGYKISAYGSWEFGQIYKGIFENHIKTHQWVQSFLGGVALSKQLGPRSTFSAGGEFKTWYYYPQMWGLEGNYPSILPVYSAYLDHIVQKIVIGDVESPFANLSIGYFPFKYNENARNLGEYLFRARAYPQLIKTTFDYPLERILGIEVNSNILSNAMLQILFTSETRDYPLWDFSLTFLVDYSLANKVFNLGAGIQLERILPVDPSKTTPKVKQNVFYDDTRDYGHFYIDSLDSFVLYDDTTADSLMPSTYYSFQGIKLMAKKSINLEPLLPEILCRGKPFGPYVEIAVLGLQNRGLWYRNIWERIPIMFGLNIPTMGLLDVLAVEAEYFACRYPNSAFPIAIYNLPHPVAHIDRHSPKEYKLDNWHWSVYLNRKFGSFGQITAQIASDHYRSTKLSGNDYAGDWFRNPRHFYWMIKLSSGF